MTDKKLRIEILKKLNEISDLFINITDDCTYYDEFEEGLDKAINAMTLAKKTKD